MTELQAALGVSQIKRLEQFIAACYRLANRCDELLKGLPLVTPYQLEDTYSGLHLYVICLQLANISLTRREVFEALREREVGVNLHYIPVHIQSHYKNGLPCW